MAGGAHHTRGSSDFNWMFPTTRHFEPVRKYIDNDYLSGKVSQTALRAFTGYLVGCQYASAALSSFNPLMAGALTLAHWVSDSISASVEGELTSDPDDGKGIQEITKIALVCLQALVCSLAFSVNLPTFASYFLVAELSNACTSGAIGFLRSYVDPCFAPVEEQ